MGRYEVYLTYNEDHTFVVEANDADDAFNKAYDIATTTDRRALLPIHTYWDSDWQDIQELDDD